jgi:type II secretion system protein G
MVNIMRAFFSCKRHAFTLIELLIVVAIIAILAAIAVPNFMEAQTRSKVSRVKADMRSLATALEAYCVDTNKYPPAKARNDLWGANPPEEPLSFRMLVLTTPISYITVIPSDPFLPKHADPSWIPDTFDYWDNFSTKQNYSSAEPDFVLYADFGAAWRLASSGPDRIDYFGQDRDRDEYAKIGGESVYYPGIYDATNGTMSKGDIIALQGSKDPWDLFRQPYQ